MKRQFKFRAWHKELKVMINFDLESLSEGNGVVWFFTDDYRLDHNPEKYWHGWPTDNRVLVMEYLGEDCKDSEGMEICEGDLLTNEFLQGKLVQVKYALSSFYVEELHKFKNNNYLRQSAFREFVEHQPCKIIGNIHQNPELLKGE